MSETEEALCSDPIELRRETRKREERWMQIGMTSAGRILIVVTTRHGEKNRVVTAFPANRAYRAFYTARKERINHGDDQDTTGNS